MMVFALYVKENLNNMITFCVMCGIRLKALINGLTNQARFARV